MNMLAKLLIAVSLFMGLTGITQAERKFYNCDVVQLGPHADGNVYIALDCATVETKTWHIVDATLGNKGMAVGLAAMALGSPVMVNVDPAVPFSDMTAIFLNSQ